MLAIFLEVDEGKQKFEFRVSAAEDKRSKRKLTLKRSKFVAICGKLFVQAAKSLTSFCG